MPRRLATLAAAALVVTGVSSISPPAASAGHDAKECGIISKGSQDYRVRASYLKCKVARRGSKRYLRSGNPRSGYDCAPTEGGGFYCQNPPKAYWAVRL